MKIKVIPWLNKDGDFDLTNFKESNMTVNYIVNCFMKFLTNPCNTEVVDLTASNPY